jgi:hypothetical protein
VIRFAPQPQRTACPLTKKAIFENLESDQSVARLVNPNFGLAAQQRALRISQLAVRKIGVADGWAPSAPMTAPHIPSFFGTIRPLLYVILPTFHALFPRHF